MLISMFLIVPLTAGMSIAAWWDLRTQKIPNLLTYPMMLFGLAYHGLTAGFDGLGFSVAGLLVGTSIFLVPYMLGGMGAGDAKLMGAVGALLGTTAVLVAAVISVLIGLFYAIVLLVIHRAYGAAFIRRSWSTLKTFLFTRQWIYVPPGKEEKQPVLSYALPIAVGTLFTVFLRVSGSNLIQQLLGFQFSI
jgi:prepilin peptidase CpaA